jgi:Domain of unknown function (DUF4129)
VVVALALALTLVCAALAPDGLPFIPRSDRTRIVVPDFPLLAEYLVAVLAAMLVIVYVGLRVAAVHEGVARPRRSARGVGIVLMLLVLLYLVPPLTRAVERLVGERGGRARVERTEAPSVPPGERAPERSSSSALGWALTAALILVMLAVAAAAAALLRPVPVEPDEDDVDRALLASLDAGVEDLRAIEDPRAAIIACYARMERVVAMAGVRRRPADTPFELLERVLAQHRIEPGSARRLTVLFERARFSRRPIDEDMRAGALDALAEVRGQLGVTA